MYVCIQWMNHEFDLAQEFCLFLCMILCLGFVSQPNILVLCLGCVQLQADSKVMQSSWLCEVNTKIQQTKMLVMCQRFGVLFLFGLVFYQNSSIELNFWLEPKIQQTKMLVMCQMFGDLFLFGLVWKYSTNQNQCDKGRFKVMATYLQL